MGALAARAQTKAVPPAVIDTTVCNQIINVQKQTLAFIGNCKYSGEIKYADIVRQNMQILMQFIQQYKAQLIADKVKKRPYRTEKVINSPFNN